MDEMAFLVPVRVGDLVHAEAQVNWAGRSSMEVGVRVLAERWDQVEEKTRVATAYLVFVGVDSDGQPRCGTAAGARDRGRAPALHRGGDPAQLRLARRDAITTSRTAESDPS